MLVFYIVTAVDVFCSSRRYRDLLVVFQRLKSGGERIEDFEDTGDDALREKLSENEKIMRQMSETWEEKLQKTGEPTKTVNRYYTFRAADALMGCE